MKRPWGQIKESLAAQRPVADKIPASEFWDDFNARAALRNQDAIEPARKPMVFSLAAATACASVIVAVTLFTYGIGRRSFEGGNSITAFDVLVPHSAVIIVNDDPSVGTILWVVDMEDEGAVDGDHA
jgi:hypothetical protein